MTHSLNVPQLLCSDGLFDFYIVEYYTYITSPKSISITKSILIRAPEGMSAAVRCHMLMREGKLKQWDRIRPATKDEVKWWMERHKEKLV